MHMTYFLFFDYDYFAKSESLMQRTKIPPIMPQKKMSRIPHTVSSDAFVAFFIFERVIPPKIKGKIAMQPNIILKIINTFAAVFIDYLLFNIINSINDCHNEIIKYIVIVVKGFISKTKTKYYNGLDLNINCEYVRIII